MRVLGVLAAWGVLAVLSTMCFALGGSLGYRRGVRDTLVQVRERRTGKSGCRPLPANHLRRRTSGHARPGARSRRARWRPGHVVPSPVTASVAAHSDPRVTVLAASVAAVLLIGVPGTAIGATTARPGESLWKVKLGLETMRVALSTDVTGDTEVHVKLASARLAELRFLADDGDVTPRVVADVSGDLEAHATAAGEGLGQVEDDRHRSQLGRRLNDLVVEQVEAMDALVLRDCVADGDQRDCQVLSAMRDGSADLRDATSSVVQVAVADVSTVPARTVAQVEVNERVAVARPDGSDGDAPGGSAKTDTAAQKQTPKRDPAGAGDPAAVTAVSTTPASASSATPSAPTPSSTPAPVPTTKPSPKPTSSPSPTASPPPEFEDLGGGGAKTPDEASGKAGAAEAESAGQ